MKPQLETYNNRTCLKIDNGEIFRKRDYVALGGKYHNQEGLILFAGFIPDYGSAPQVEFYMGLIAGDQYGAFSDQCPLFIGVYKSPLNWQYNTVKPGYYSFDLGAGFDNNLRVVKKVGTTITDSGVNPTYVQSIAHMGAASNKRLAIIGTFYFVSGTTTHNFSPKVLIGTSPDSYYYDDLFWQRNVLACPSCSANAYGRIYPAGTTGNFALTDAESQTLTHIYFGWRTVSGNSLPLLLMVL